MTFTEIVDKCTPGERLNECLDAFCKCETQLRRLDLETGSVIYSDAVREIIASLQEGLARALMHVVMDLGEQAK